ncbi:MAG: flagellar basal body P-ring formation chaperone FlgA [Deltaproteobacteria bacterium]|nr:flagellar basal body P-ring formation chaperone FlgA [Deltaproteobacteria bacterium]
MSRALHILVIALVPLLAEGDARHAGSTEVEGPWVRVRDVVRGCGSPSCDTGIVLSPPPGQVLVVRREDVARAVAAAGFDGKALRIPESRSVVRSAREASSVEIGAAIAAELGRVLPEGLVIEKMEKIGAVLVPASGYSVAARWPATGGFERRVSVPVDLIADDVPFRRLQAVVTLAALLRIPVAARDLPAGAVIGANDVEDRQVRFTSMPTDLAGGADDVAGRLLLKPVRKGEAFVVRDLERIPVVRRGQQIHVESRAGLVRVTMAGVAREDGAVGERIRVVSDSSGRLLWATVLAPGRAKVCP